MIDVGAAIASAILDTTPEGWVVSISILAMTGMMVVIWRRFTLHSTTLMRQMNSVEVLALILTREDPENQNLPYIYSLLQIPARMQKQLEDVLLRLENLEQEVGEMHDKIKQIHAHYQSRGMP